ncbi:Doubled CXXCH motif (Paired_CXXCH_1) [Roseovarius litorisediminis]|uniref:Doubled CXXCH motif (Paired_CXXCH_1) n=2 Tax=Roseovarius litorisediminis TaxID=1312363 RepID=A0A1Y5R5K0_9RHOB|nr:Doubled CXXCH motif (Paired_CXXCH_1) [Roseovarius litorisediminis]
MKHLVVIRHHLTTDGLCFIRLLRIFLVIIWLCLLWSAFSDTAQAGPQRLPDYVGSAQCQECHQDAYESWKVSHHALAWTTPDAANILGDFNQSSFEHLGVMTRFSKGKGIHYIETDGPDGALTKYPVAGVAGIEPLQQYLLETEPGKLQSFDVVWDVEKQRWYHLYPEQELYGGNGLHWTGPYKNWNARCAECHATGFEKNYAPANRSYASTQSEIGVGCEACHGPGEAHNIWADPDLIYDADDWQGVSQVGLTMDFNRGVEATIQQCASCHARREPYTDGNPLPGTPFHDAYRLSTLREGLYHPDGQILDEVYVYGSFLQSKMYAKGVGCIDCHNAHAADLKADGNTVCTQCHSPAGNSNFPSLKLANYDDPSHHFHETGSAGAQCKSCHMIERTYMGIDGRRDHSFRVPRPDLSVRLRTPNACSDCHSDKTATWAAEQVAEWYPDGSHTTPHFAETLAPARVNAAAEVEGLIGMATYGGLPGIVRASALELLIQIDDPSIAERTALLLDDSDAMVRSAAVRLQRGVRDSVAVQRLAPLLEDSSRTVRMAAAREFLTISAVRLPPSLNSTLQMARSEWQQSLAAKTDFPETHIIIAGVGLATRQFDAALAAFQEVVTQDPQYVAAWTMMVRIHAALGDRNAALGVVDSAIKANPSDVSLSLLRADLLQ